MGVGLGLLMDLHLLHLMLAVCTRLPKGRTYHLERVELLLDLLCKDGSESVASSNLSTSIVVRSRPSIVELDARAEADPDRALRGRGQAPGAWICQTRGFRKVVLGHFVLRCAGSA
jgi:hypothetical protein